MRISKLVALAMVSGVSTQAARAERTAEQKVAVYLVNDANVRLQCCLGPERSRPRFSPAWTFGSSGARASGPSLSCYGKGRSPSA